MEPVDRDPRLQSRIPLRPYPGQELKDILCGETPKDVFPTWQTATDSADGFHIDSFDPALEADRRRRRREARPLAQGRKTGGAAAGRLDEAWTKDVSAPNACLYFGGPTHPRRMIPIRPAHGASARARAFRNTQVAFVLADIDRAPPAASTLHFDVHGGFRQASVVNLTTVQVSSPARLVLGPIDSTRIDMVPTKAAPFFFVVDQRRLGTGQGGGPTRGQIVRVNPFGLAANGYLPVYEDYTASHGLFPIQ